MTDPAPAPERPDGPRARQPRRPRDPEAMARMRADFRQAALRAEYATGDREKTEESARRRVITRVAIIVAGVVVSLAGLAMMVLPGPGLAVLIIGLGILAQEVAWADRLLDEVKRRAKVDKLQRQPLWVKAAAIVGGLAAAAASTIWALSG